MTEPGETSATDVTETIELWRKDGRRVALATVVDTKRSAPQPIGTKMAVQDGGQIVGAVPGGCVEGAVVEIAEEILAGAEPRLAQFGIDDGEAWDVGLPCGGEISVWVEGYTTESLQARFTERARAGGRAAIVTALEGTPQPGSKLLVGVDELPLGTFGEPGLDAAALALAEAALWSERRAFVIDPRSRFATSERFPGAEQVIAAWPEEAFSQLEAIDAATAIAVLTHDPKLDDAALIAALASPARYIGAMGSRHAQARRRVHARPKARPPGVSAPIAARDAGARLWRSALRGCGRNDGWAPPRSGGRASSGRATPPARAR